MTAILPPPVAPRESAIAAIRSTAPATSDVAIDDRAVRRWLWSSAACVVVALVVGGITRLTESGLSITEWRPVSGVIPPLSDAEWSRAFADYLRIPEAQTVHRGITMAEFRALYWWEWVHRILARLVGLVIALPFFVLLLRGRIRPALQMRLSNLPILVAAQGVLGWYMVQSGLAGRTDVSPYRLVAHLGVALLIYVIAAWTAMTLRRTSAWAVDRSGLVVATLAMLTILSGGFVAGLDAGQVYNTFPMMGSGVVPAEYGQLAPLWRNWFENPVTAQFNHRVLAMLTLAAALGAWWWRGIVVKQASARGAWRVVALLALLQLALGVATLLLAVPIPLAALHQMGAIALLTAGMWAAVHGGTE